MAATALSFVATLWARGHGFGLVGLGLLLGWREDYALAVALGWTGLAGLLLVALRWTASWENIVLLVSVLLLLVSFAGFFKVSIVRPWTAISGIPFVVLALDQATVAVIGLWRSPGSENSSREV